jgi:hypothetical protein
MQGDTRRPINDLGTATLRLRRACVAAALIGAGALVGGCGGGSPGAGAGVASLGSHTSTTSTTGSATPGSSEGRETSPGSQAVAYAACMRSHGVANFPEPVISRSAGATSVKMVVRVGTINGSPKFKSAQQACIKLLPMGGAPTNQPTVSTQEQEQYLKAAACIRSHGLPKFPDPTFTGGGVHIDHQALNESSPVFKAAVHACESLIPGGVHDH